jgi:phosphopantothenoylcysteine decarboxylase/phosphopantothenate--cysteine ligase
MRGKRILLGVTGGIAAYKIPLLVRLLVKAGADVRCMMTSSALDFVSPLTLSTLSKNPVYSKFWNAETGEWANHVDLALWADLIVMAPLTANSMAKMVGGQSDSFLLTTYLSAKCPVMVAPAMDLDMYQHPTTKRNIASLEKDGVYVIPAESGELASGLSGEGRLPEVETLFEEIEKHFERLAEEWSDKRVLITAGPSHEVLDPVRFIGNNSTGKMGITLAEECASMGAEVTLLLGPSSLSTDLPRINTIRFKSAEELLSLTKEHWSKQDIGIFSAAVADYRPKDVAKEKIKKKDDSLSLELVKNPDILAWAGSVKSENQFLVGFALETQNEKENAFGKLERKNLDFIVLNSLRDEGAGFAKDTNKISILDRNKEITDFNLKSKQQVARDIVVYLKDKLAK